MSAQVLRVAVLGAGPVGLDAALACADAGWRSPSTRPGTRWGPTCCGGGMVGYSPLVDEHLRADARAPLRSRRRWALSHRR